MKKIFLAIIFLLSINTTSAYISGWSCDNVFWAWTALERTEKYWIADPLECWTNHYAVEDNECYYIKEAKTWEILHSFCDRSYFHELQTDKYQDYSKLTVVDLFESKYNNYVFSSVRPRSYSDEHKNIIGKFENFMWWYLNGKMIYAFSSFDSDKETIWYKWNLDFVDSFYKFTPYYATDNPQYEHWTIKAPVLSQKSQDRLNTFIDKIEKSKYDKVYLKIDEIRKDYTNMDSYRHRFIKEVLDYIYFEMKVKELMSNDWVSGYMKYDPSW